MLIHSFLFILYIFCYYKSYTDSAKVTFKPPAQLLLDIATKYLKISNTVLVTHENSGVFIDEYLELLHEHTVYTSVFQWKQSESLEDQFTNFVKVIRSQKHYRVIFFLDFLSSEIFIKQAHLVKDKLSLVCFYRWIFFDFDRIDMRPLYYANTSAVCWRSLFVTTKDPGESEDTEFNLYGSTFQKDGNCILEDPIGSWTPTTGLMNSVVFRRRIMDYNNICFMGSVLNTQPFYSTTEDGKHEGMEYDLLKTLKRRLNFRVKLIPNTDDEFGNRLPNGTWTGYIGLITSGKAVFSIATLTISNRRMTAVDFSSPYIFGKMSFVILSPALESRKFVLIKPLHKEVWAALVATLIVCTFVLYLITHSLPCKSGVRRSYNIWFLLRTFGQQGTPSPAPARYSIRFFISGWWFFIMVILWSYAGTLTSFMTYPGRRPAVDTVHKLQQALKSGSIRYGTTKGTTYEHFLTTEMEAANPIFGKSLRENPEGLVKDVLQGMEMVLKGKYAFVYMKAILKWWAATMGYDIFRFSKDVFSTEAIGIACQKCHPLKRSFDHLVDRLEETGLLSKWYDNAFTKAQIRAPQVHIPGVRALSFDDVQGAFYFLGFSLLISTSVFFLEIIVFNISHFIKKLQKEKLRKRKVQFYGFKDHYHTCKKGQLQLMYY